MLLRYVYGDRLLNRSLKCRIPVKFELLAIIAITYNILRRINKEYSDKFNDLLGASYGEEGEGGGREEGWGGEIGRHAQET